MGRSLHTQLYINIIIEYESQDLIEHTQTEEHQLPQQLNLGTCDDIKGCNQPNPKEPMSYDSPFSTIYMDIFQADQSYLAIMDRHLNWQMGGRSGFLHILKLEEVKEAGLTLLRSLWATGFIPSWKSESFLPIL